MKIFSKIERDEVFTFETFDFYNAVLVKKLVKQYNIDIIHFHWCGAGFFSVNSIKNLKNYKVVITFHDYHLSTGGCHIPMGCKEFTDCKRCPLLPKDKFLTPFWERLIQYRKKLFHEVIKNKNIRFVSPSKYTYDFLSSDIEDTKHYLIGNVIGEKYYNVSLNYIENIFNLKINDKANVLFVGIKQSTRDNKGFLYLSRLVEISIKENWSIYFNFVACDIPECIELYRFTNYSNYDYLDDGRLIQLYSSADMCVVPSKFETFSQVCLESIACCTPVIAFDLTGPNEILGQEFPVFLVPAFDENLFIQKIFELLSYKKENFPVICKKRDNICQKYSPSRIVLSHDTVYNSFDNVKVLVNDK